jgi:DNA invertase Pin-like site-specific DNA recombinase
MNRPNGGKNPSARKRGGRPRRALDSAQIQRLQTEGLSLPQIAGKLHAGYGTVYRMGARPST